MMRLLPKGLVGAVIVGLALLAFSPSAAAGGCAGGRVDSRTGKFTCTQTTPPPPKDTGGSGVSYTGGSHSTGSTGSGGGKTGPGQQVKPILDFSGDPLPDGSTGLGLKQNCNAGPACFVFSKTAPPAAQPAKPAPMSPREAALRAFATLSFTAAAPGMGPDHSNNGLHDDETGKAFDNAVGYPVWLWADGGDTNTRSVTDTVGGVVVSITIRFDGTTWDMGDGTTLNCGVGTPWVKGKTPGAHSPSQCDHVYEKRGPKTVTITSNWSVDLRAGTYAATVPVAIDRSRLFRIGELQVLVQ